MSIRRRKRASPTDLYKQCQLGADCPTDVKNKIEGDTWADRLLKWFGSVIYLGGLGIGTGKGTGGASGYRPLDTPVTGRGPSTNLPIRPSVPVEIVPETIPGLINPEAPSIIPLTDLTVEPSVVIDAGVGGPVTGVTEDITVVIEADNPVFDINTVQSRPTVVTSPNEAAVLDISSSTPPPRRVVLQNAPETIRPLETIMRAEVENVFVDPQSSGATVGNYEEIELGIFNEPSTFEIEYPSTSTPSIMDRITGTMRQYYNRFVQQVPVRNPAFLGQPSRLVVFENENPAFTPDELTLRFQEDVAEVAAAPEPDFSDVRVLHRQILSETPGGTIRASRLGNRGTILTRSGTQIGQTVHFYYDISAIDTAESIELLPINMSNESVIADSLAETEFTEMFSGNILATEDNLSEVSDYSFSNSHLILTSSETEDASIIIPGFISGPVKFFFPSLADSITVLYPNQYSYNIPLAKLTTPVADIIYSPNLSSIDYDLDPSLLPKRKRRRKYSF